MSTKSGQLQLQTWLSRNESLSRFVFTLIYSLAIHQELAFYRSMNTTTLSIVLQHLIPALQSIQRDLFDAEIKDAAPQPKSEPALREGSGEPKRLYKVAEAAAFLNVSQSLIRKLTMTKRIPYYKIGSRVMFSEEQLLSWVKAFEHVPEAFAPQHTEGLIVPTPPTDCL